MKVFHLKNIGKRKIVVKNTIKNLLRSLAFLKWLCYSEDSRKTEIKTKNKKSGTKKTMKREVSITRNGEKNTRNMTEKGEENIMIHLLVELQA